MDPAPSPDSSSPSSALGSLEHSSQPSRKRQRSLSMQSDSAASSSSVKRSVADNYANDSSIRSSRADQLSTLTLTDPNQDIDAYMAEQGEANIPPSIDMATSQIDPTMTSLSLQDKYSVVEKDKSKKMDVGETWYLVSRLWYKRWMKACTGIIDKEGPVEEKDLGPVDNSSLLDTYSNLLPSLVEGEDVEYVPEGVWNMFTNWYGTPIHPLPRRVIARGALKEATIELRPPVLKVFKLVRSTANAVTPPPTVTISAAETISTLCSKLAEAVSPTALTSTPYRVWVAQSRIDRADRMEYPSYQISLSDAKILDESSKTLEEEGIESGDAFFVEFKQGDGWILPVASVSSSSDTSMTLFNSNDGFFNKMASGYGSSSSTSTYRPGTYSSTSKSTSTALTLPNKSIVKTLEPGTLGLGNMGNTCFMNSALQCLAHTKELTDYFLSGVYEGELNRDNPLGMGGAIAEAFGALLQRIWSSSGSSTSYSPRDFKLQLQRFAPQFSGYQQHDSQELVAFLLDGLHEDLNRVIKKPYVEKPDWEGGGDLELANLANTSWEGYMKRNDSVIVDLFQGQYQSTLVCPECQKVSITFDPFMYLTLPLPITKKWKHPIYFVPWDLDKKHVKVPVEINRDASFKDLRGLLGRWLGTPPENLLLLEIFNHRFYKNLEDHLPVGEMTDNDTIVCFELPCNARQGRGDKKKPTDPIIVPVYLCDAKQPMKSSYFTSNRANTPTLFGYPMVIAIDQQQAQSVDAMYDAVITRLSRWTEHARDMFQWEEGPGSEFDDVSIPISRGDYTLESVTEIREDGNVVTVERTPAEGDIVDEKDMVLDVEDQEHYRTGRIPYKVGTKKNVFNLRLQVNHKDLGTMFNLYSSNNRWESWENRLEEADAHPVLLRDDDAFYCEFEEDTKAYFFGDSLRHEHALWDAWGSFTHPELEETKKASGEKRKKGITLQDCLDEFTREEQLGEDDLWYCPSCKKHQQATKKFDLWKAPDILAVHLKRFSNNRSLRDKIDAHVDFPIEGLDLTDMVRERAVAKRLVEQGVDVSDLNLTDTGEPLLYDLYAVDEHIGGLGGGHYRAYASNHLTGKWHHFDDSYVSPARASDSVNSNAYLLFYRRRMTGPLGGKTSIKIEEASSQSKADTDGTMESDMKIGTQLPTPPNEPAPEYDPREIFRKYNPPHRDVFKNLGQIRSDNWNLRSAGSNAGSSVPSPPTEEPPDFDDGLPGSEPLYGLEHYNFSHSSNKASPTSSIEAELDIDGDRDREWENFDIDSNNNPPEWEDGVNAYADTLEMLDPFSDGGFQKVDDGHDSSSHEKTV